MTRAGRKTGGGSRFLAPDEAELWDYATRSLAKVKAKQRVTAKATADEAPPRRQAAPPDRDASPVRRAGSGAAPGRSPPPAAGPVARAPPMADFDRREARRIAGGKAEVDARIDLHGLRQRDAHGRLRAFLFDAHARGLKTVLVITGKGGSERTSGASAEDQPRGVLRRNVPHWLREADIQSIVVSFTEAGARHGGTGALYIRLRRRMRAD